MKRYLIYAIIGLVIFNIALLKMNRQKSKEIDRQASNFEQITKENERQLNLTVKEYESVNAEWKDKIDSIRNEYDIKLKHVKEATVTKVVYRDTGSVKVIYGDTQVILKDTVISHVSVNTYKIPVIVNDGCWGFTGNIESTDSASKLNVLERNFNNSIQILVTEKRRWIFWKKREFKAFSDCGTLDVTQVDFEK